MLVFEPSTMATYSTISMFFECRVKYLGDYLARRLTFGFSLGGMVNLLIYREGNYMKQDFGFRLDCLGGLLLFAPLLFALVTSCHCCF